MTEDTTQTPRPKRLSTRTALIATALLGLGVAGGAAAVQLGGPSIEMAPATPVPIASVKDGDGTVVTLRGRVVEGYGPMFVLADASGRVLVDGGRQADGTGLATPGEVLSVQGRVRHGLMRASFLVGADGKVTALHPFGPPHGGPGEGHGPHGRPGGTDRADGPPPPAEPAPSNAAAPADG